MGMGGGIITKSGAKSASIEVVITRADGTVENLGVVSFWHKNPLMVWAWQLKRLLRGK